MMVLSDRSTPVHRLVPREGAGRRRSLKGRQRAGAALFVLATVLAFGAASSLDPYMAAFAPGRPPAGPTAVDALKRIASGGAHPGLLWVGDFETGDLSQYGVVPTNDVGGATPTIVTSPVRDGRYAVRLGVKGATTAADGICCGTRNELVPRFPDLHEGDDLWFGFSTYLADGWPLYPDWQAITQFKQNFDGAPPLALFVEDAQYKVEGGYGYPAGSRPFSLPIAPVRTGIWVDWVWHVKFSADPGIGFVEIWKDDVLVLPRYAPPSGTLYPASGNRAGNYVKTGPYRDPTLTTPETMYLDDWRIGASRAAVER